MIVLKVGVDLDVQFPFLALLRFHQMADDFMLDSSCGFLTGEESRIGMALHIEIAFQKLSSVSTLVAVVLRA